VRFGHTATIVGSQLQFLLFFGGADDDRICLPQTVQLFDSHARTFRHVGVVGTAPRRCSGHTATLDWSGNRIVFIGGVSSKGERSDHVDILHGVRFDNDNEGLRWNTKHPAQWHLRNNEVNVIQPEYDIKGWCGCNPKSFPDDNYEGQVSRQKMELYHHEHWVRYRISEDGDKFEGRSHHTCVLRGLLFWVFGGLVSSGARSDELFTLDLSNFGTEKMTGLDRQSAIPLPAKKTDRIWGQYYRVNLEGQVVSFRWAKRFASGDNPSGRAGHTAALTNDNKFMVVVGGQGGEAGELHLLNLNTLTWTLHKVKESKEKKNSNLNCRKKKKVPNLPLLCNHSMTMLGNTNRILLFGGFDEYGTALNNMYVVDMMEWVCSQVNAQG
jgi:hypothetical protein